MIDTSAKRMQAIEAGIETLQGSAFGVFVLKKFIREAGADLLARIVELEACLKRVSKMRVKRVKDGKRIVELEAKSKEAEKRADEAVTMLRRLERSGSDRSGFPRCPYCLALDFQSHRLDCGLAFFLRLQQSPKSGQ